MVNVYDACKQIGAEDMYENHFFYDPTQKKVYVVGAHLNKKQVGEFLDYVNNEVSVELINVINKGEKKEYQALEEYLKRGTRLITNKNPLPVDQKLLEELIFTEKRRRNCQKAGQDIKKQFLNSVHRRLDKAKKDIENGKSAYASEPIEDVADE